MTSRCPSCRQTVPTDHAVIINKQIEARWDSWERIAKLVLNTTFNVQGVGDVTLRQRETNWDASYGEGEYSPISLVVQIGERYFRKYGTTDSYSEQKWEGTMIEVFPRQEILTRYEEKLNDNA